MNIAEVIKKEVEPHLEKTAVIDPTGCVTYSELISLVEKTSQKLKGSGVKPAERIAFLCEDSIDYIVLSLAILYSKAVVVPISPSLSWDEVNSVLERIDVHYLVFEKDAYHMDNALKLDLKHICRKDFFILKRKTKTEINEEYFKLNPAFIRFSSGTTGESKGIVLSHKAILERTDAANKGLTVKSSDIIIWVLSMSFHFVVTILLFLRKAATIVICGKDFPQLLIQALKDNKTTFIYASPFHYYVMLKTQEFNREMFSNVRIAVSTAMKLSVDCALDFSRKFSINLCEAYGIIEVGLPFINFSKNVTKFGSVGRVLPDYKIKIEGRDKDGVGQIYIKGKGMACAYFSPWQNQKEILQKGWFDTGDLGKIDPDGYLFIVGRAKAVINFAGMKIFPYEVENIINQYEGVSDSLVYGVAHAQYGQLPYAKIVLKEGFRGGFNLEGLRKFCYRNLAQYKVPKDFSIVESLPRTPSGKIKRDAQAC